jgi:uncharacterized repeat protein (TIGR01451 family)
VTPVAESDTCTVAGSTATCTLHDVSDYQVRQLNVGLTISEDYEGEVSLSASLKDDPVVQDPDPTNNASSTSGHEVVPNVPDLWVTLDAPARVELAGEFAYTVKYGNSGPLPADDVIVTVRVHDDAHIDAASAGGVISNEAHTATWTLEGIWSGDDGQQTLLVTAPPGLVAGEVFSGFATITTNTEGDAPGNNSASAAVTVDEFEFDAEMTLTPSATEVDPGDTLGYTLSLKNTGDYWFTPSVKIAIPEGTEFVQGSAAADKGVVVWQQGQDHLRWTHALSLGEDPQTLDLEESAEISFSVTVTACGGSDCNILQADALLEPLEIEATLLTHIISAFASTRCPDLWVEASATTMLPFGTLDDERTLNLSFGNDSSHAAHEVTLSFELMSDSPVEITSATPQPAYLSETDVAWLLGDIASLDPAGQASVTVRPLAFPDPETLSMPLVHAIAQITYQEFTNPFGGLECSDANTSNVADLTLHPLTVDFNKLASPKWFPRRDTSTLGLDGGVFRFDYLLHFKYGNLSPIQPALNTIEIVDSWPQELTLVSHVDPPSSTFTTSGIGTPDGALTWTTSAAYYPNTTGQAQASGLISDQDLALGDQIVNTATLKYTLLLQEFVTTTSWEAEAWLMPPLITAPGSGELCAGPVTLRGVAQRGATVKVVINGEVQDAQAAVVDAWGAFEASLALPADGQTHEISALSCEPSGTSCSGPSNTVSLRGRDDIPWDPQRSYWTGEVDGLQIHYSLRDSAGQFATDDWRVQGLFAAAASELHLYSCCSDEGEEVVIIADGVEITPTVSGPEGDDPANVNVFDLGPVQSVEIRATCDGTTHVSTGQVLIDPDGYVFNAAQGWGHVIPGATVSCMWWMPDWGGWVPWPAHLYEQQQNPQVTGASGYFAFFTPPGFYHLDVQGPDGFQRWRSPVVEVINEIVHVNVPYTAAPAADPLYSLEVSPDGLRAPDGEPGGALAVPVGAVVSWTSVAPSTSGVEGAAALFERPVVRVLSSLDPLADPRGFDSGMLRPGASYARSFDAAGTYPYGTGTGHAGVVMVYDEGDPPPPVVDEDGDGAPDVLEMGPTGDDADYDGDGDGAPDASQDSVVSLTNCRGIYVTARTHQGRLAGVSSLTNPSPDDLPPGTRLVDCFYRVHVEGTPEGGAVVVDFFIPDLTADAFLAYGPGADLPLPHWQSVAVEAGDGLWAEPTANGFSAHLVDGAAGDADGQADGGLTAGLAPAGAGHRLAVRVQGGGAVVSDPPGVGCPQDCDEWFPEGAVVTLNAQADAGAALEAWSEPSCGGALTCTVTMSQARAVVARFEIEEPTPDAVEACEVVETHDVIEVAEVIEHPETVDASEDLTSQDSEVWDLTSLDVMPDSGAASDAAGSGDDVTPEAAPDRDGATGSSADCSGCALSRRSGDDGAGVALLLCLAVLAAWRRSRRGLAV